MVQYMYIIMKAMKQSIISISTMSNDHKMKTTTRTKFEYILRQVTNKSYSIYYSTCQLCYSLDNYVSPLNADLEDRGKLLLLIGTAA